MSLQQFLKNKIRDVPDFPKPGILFKDITPLLRDPSAFEQLIQAMVEPFQSATIDAVVGIESRGFIIGAPMAHLLKVGFIPVRKPGKLPAKTYRVEYELEYGIDALEIHQDAAQAGQKVLLVDDLLATGGTALATVQLLKKMDVEVVAASFIIELTFLKGQEKLKPCKVTSLIQY